MDGRVPALVEVPVIPMRDRLPGLKQGLKDLIQDSPLPLTILQ